MGGTPYFGNLEDVHADPGLNKRRPNVGRPVDAANNNARPSGYDYCQTLFCTLIEVLRNFPQ